MADIILSTLNAKYIHAAFGIRYLLANLGPLRERACLMEFDLSQHPVQIAETLLSGQPKIIGLGIYIWNVAPATELVTILKRVCPEVIVILGGPEVSFESEQQQIVQTADYVITGEADLKFAELCQQLLNGARPNAKVIPAPLPDLNTITMPYDLYDDRDVQHRVIYVEASRGCPFTCEFCLSSLDVPVRQFPLPALLHQLQVLLERGVQQFKFVDRTFNLNLKVGRTLLEFFRERYRPWLFLHFEMIPDRLPEALREIIQQFPPNALQFEVGIQTFDQEVADRISRRQNYALLEDNFRFLRTQTGVHIHADLIAGLPGETLESFGAGFDRLVALNPQEIQVGILKRLRGTPIVRHDVEWQMVYNSHPPYEVLATKTIPFLELQQLRRFARTWDLMANSGNFVETTPLLWQVGGSPFKNFMGWSEWLHVRLGRTHSIGLTQLAGLFFEYLTGTLNLKPTSTAELLWQDYQRGGRSDVPLFLRAFVPDIVIIQSKQPTGSKAARRQARHHRDHATPRTIAGQIMNAGELPPGETSY